MSSKRSHTKSRRGCTQCKSRHIKCDEAPPSCGNCTRKGLKCDYEEFRPAFDKIRLFTPTDFHPKTAGSGSRDASSSQSVTPNQQSLFTLEDLGLMHHFTLHTSQTIPPIESAEYRRIWQDEVPCLAQSYDFLMYAIVAFAAAHRAILTSDDGASRHGSDVARCHYSKAMSCFQQSVHDITSERADALLCFCILILLLSIHFEAGKSAEEQDGIEEFRRFLQILHSSAEVLSSVSDSLQSSSVGGLLKHTDVNVRNEIPPDLAESLNQLQGRVVDHFLNDSGPTGLLSIAINAIDNLRGFFTLADPHPSSWQHMLTCPITLGPDFAILLDLHEPIALSIIAYWFVPAFNAPAKWYIGQWPRRVMTAIRDKLDNSPWAECITWPVDRTIGRRSIVTN